MFEFLSYKSKFALCVAGAFIGFALCVYGFNTPSTPLDLRFILHPAAYFGMALNLAVAGVAMILSLGMLAFDIIESSLLGSGNRYL